MGEKKYGSIITAIGQASVANAAVLGQKVNITAFAVGDGGGGYYYPQAEMTALKGEVWRGEVYEYKATGNQIEISVLIPSAIGGFTMREMGLLDDKGQLIALANMPDTEKIVIEDGAASEMQLTMVIHVSNAEVVSFQVDPTVILATRKDIEKHNADKNAHESKADADLSNVPSEVLGAKLAEGGLGSVVVIPEGETIPVIDRKKNTIYFQVTDVQSGGIAANVRVSPNMGLKLDEGTALQESKSGILFE